MKSAILGRKLGMTSIYTAEGEQVPCTVIEAGPCYVVLNRTPEKDGYSAVQIGFEEVPERKLSKPQVGHFKKSGVNKFLRHLKEFRDPESEYNPGDEINVNNFAAGDLVKVSGDSKGRGFQGVVKRHGFSGVGMQTHGQKNRERHPGSIGQSSYPSRVLKGLRMGGQMGGKRVSVRNLTVIDVIPDQNLLIIKGSIPGGKNTLLEIVKQ